MASGVAAGGAGMVTTLGAGVAANRGDRLLTKAITACTSASVRWFWGTMPVDGMPWTIVCARSASVGTWPEPVERNLNRPLVRSRGGVVK